MPFTPYHFGVGLAVHAIAPKRISFLSFCSANVLIDLEPLYYLWKHHPPMHRFFHTGAGATLVALATILLFLTCRKLTTRFQWLNVQNWKSLPLSAVTSGAFLGTYTHVLLDSIMHGSVLPFAPIFKNYRPLYHLFTLSQIHWGCVSAGVIGGIVLMIRRSKLD